MRSHNDRNQLAEASTESLDSGRPRSAVQRCSGWSSAECGGVRRELAASAVVTREIAAPAAPV
ncbi:hypothetical protein CDG81_19580 [Actinopolyspora erythraea]|uniref:Uncharacterized protein n=1 Tax=Actinopolyspora erythraea TaxID=414996 RepID=A0A099D8B3_9ACTN|nr:hypothetical protein CDG81_19580 [Actinopolyspora erythraea]KGI82171.1 hypothetical protein IL38_05310 [Actinopolyspora erythraea]